MGFCQVTAIDITIYICYYFKVPHRETLYFNILAVSNHLNLVESRDYKNAEIVEIIVTEQEDRSYPVSEWALADSTIRAKELEIQRRKEREKELAQLKIQKLERELKELKGK